LAEELGTPLYVYDLARLAIMVDDLRAILRPFGGRLFFATMANDRPQVLSRLAELGVGACVNSIPHLDLALRSGFAVQDTQFTSTAITPADMRILQVRGVRANLDSIEQLDSWFRLGGRDAGLRVNAGSLTGAERRDRIGVEARSIGDALKTAGRHGRTISGVHVYIGTNFQSPGAMEPTLRAFFDLAASIPDLTYVNIGGGIGIDYASEGTRFDIGRYGKILLELFAGVRDRLGHRIDLILEPGRCLAAPCGAFVTRVIDDKRLNGERYLGVDASIALFPRPLHHPESPHRILRVTGTPGQSGEAALVVGRTTFSKDVLGTLPAVSDSMVGELLFMENAGAYSQSMASCFLGQPAPSEAYLNEEKAMAVAAAE
jgi:diaminopimelate decarboxylase